MCSGCGKFLGRTPHSVDIAISCDDCEPFSDSGEVEPAIDCGRYGPEYRLSREQVIERDDHTCQNCGIHESDVDFLDCHHIDGDSNESQNLVMLCRVCHRRVESGTVQLN